MSASVRHALSLLPYSLGPRSVTRLLRSNHWCRLTSRNFNSTSSVPAKSRWKPRHPEHSTAPSLITQNGVSLAEFRLAVLNNDAPVVLSNYEFFASNGLLRSKDTRELIRAVQAFSSKGRYANWTTISVDVLHMIQMYKAQLLPPHAAASSHFLNILKNHGQLEEALELWSWLEKQGSEYANTGTYGTALQVLAASNQGIDISERTYEQGLDASSNPRNRYLMAPNAVLPDPCSHITTIGTSTSLLEGIAIARFTYNNWRDAYLALESAFRLHPLQTPSSFVGLIGKRRSLEEMLRFFGLYCRSGNRLKNFDLGVVLRSLAASIHSDLQSTPERHDEIFSCATAQLDVLRCCILTGQTISHKAAPPVLTGVMSCLPSQRSSVLSAAEKSTFESLAVDLNQAVVSLFPRIGCGTEALHVTSMIVSLKMGYNDLARQALTRVLPALDDSPSTLHRIAAAVITAKNAELATVLLEYLANEDTKKCGIDVLETFINKAGTQQQVSFCSELMKSFAASAEDWTILQAQAQKRAEEVGSTEPETGHAQSDVAEPEKFEQDEHSLRRQESQIQKLIEKINAIAPTFDSKNTIDLQLRPLELPTLSALLCNFPEEWHTALYHDMHISPLAQATAPPDASPHENELGTISATNLPIQQIRFECFKTFNDLLLLAEAGDTLRQRAPGTNTTVTPDKQRSRSTDVKDLRMNLSAWAPQTEEEWRSRIISLRQARTAQAS